MYLPGCPDKYLLTANIIDDPVKQQANQPIKTVYL